MKNRLWNVFNSYSNAWSPVNYLPLLEGICIQRGDAWSWVLAISGQWDSETPRRTPEAKAVRLIQGGTLLLHTRQ